MNYVDGFLVPVPEGKLDDYRAMAEKAGKVWMKYGALEFHECVADDVKPGEHTSFPQAVKLEDGETVMFSWITYKSREHRDEVMEKVMGDPFMKDFDPASMPFDGKRMIFGGFKEIVSL